MAYCSEPLTLNYGLRFDHVDAYIEGNSNGARV